MKEVSIIGLDLAKNAFQAHGASANGSVVFRRKLHRSNSNIGIAKSPQRRQSLGVDFASFSIESNKRRNVMSSAFPELGAPL